MSDTSGPPWTEEQSVELFMAIITGDADAASDWLATHVTDPLTEVTIFAGIAAWSALMIRRLDGYEADSLAIIQKTKTDVDPIALGVAQMIVAACNEDTAAVHGHIDAIRSRPDDDRVKAMATLMAYCRDFARLAFPDLGSKQ